MKRTPDSTMSRRAADALTALLAGAAALALALVTNQSGDYQSAVGFAVTDNPGPAINALADGRLHDFFALHPYMGSLSLVLRAPFVAAGHALGMSDLAVYRLGAVVCLVGVALLAIWVG